MKSFFTLLLSLFVISALAQTPFTAGNVVVYRIGNGTTTISSAANTVFLDEYTPTGTLVQSVAMPTTVTGANKRLTSGIAANEGMLTRSENGLYLIVPGYDADPGATLVNSNATNVNRVIGRVDATGNINTTTALTDAFFIGNFHSVASTDGTTFWVAGTDDLRYTTLGGTTSPTVAVSSSINSVNIFNGQLYVGKSGTSSETRVQQIGTGTPTTSGNVLVNLPGVSTANSIGQFFFADVNAAVPGVDVLYIAVPTSTIGIQKFSFNGTTWVANGSLAVGTATVRGLTGTVSGTSVTLFTTSSTNLFTITDASGHNNTMTGTVTTIATAATNTQFRGVALTPTVTALPVSLTSLTASLYGASGEVKWVSTNEINLKGFALEKSSDGISFSEISFINARNTAAANTYTFTDKNLNTGTNYYRVKSLNNDGSFRYSYVVTISNKAILKLSVFPNPAINSLTVSHGKAGETAVVQVLTLDGKLVKSLRVKPGAVQTAMAVDDLNKGTYIMMFRNNDDKFSTSFSKQ
jgi:hypothetical protein